jgi:hypothetical protein
MHQGLRHAVEVILDGDVVVDVADDNYLDRLTTTILAG